MSRSYIREFAEWRKWREEAGLSDIFDNPEDAGIDTHFRVGQQVVYTNEFGGKFAPKTICGFCPPSIHGRCVYIDDDSYWMPVRLSEIEIF